MSYSLLEPMLNEEIVFHNNEEVYCVDLVRSIMVEGVSQKEHHFGDEFSNPVLVYVEPDRIITLDILREKLIRFFYTWRSTAEALDFLIGSVVNGCLESRVYFCAKSECEPAVGKIIGLWWSAMPKNQRLKIQTMYGRHEFEDWIAGTRPGMKPENTPYLSQLVFVLQDVRKEIFENSTITS